VDKTNPFYATMDKTNFFLDKTNHMIVEKRQNQCPRIKNEQNQPT